MRVFLKGDKEELILKNLGDDSECRFTSVKEYFFNQNAHYIGLVQNDTASKVCLNLIDLADKMMKKNNVWKGLYLQIVCLTFRQIHMTISYLLFQKEKKAINLFWMYGIIMMGWIQASLLNNGD